MSRLILMITPSATEGQAGGQAAADSVNQQQNTGRADTGSSQSHTISEFSFQSLTLNSSITPNVYIICNLDNLKGTND
jgi:hypothetical protein